MAGLAGAVTTRAERQRERIARLLDQVQSAADAWVQATYACGVEDARGERSVHVTRQRETAERRFRDAAAKLAAAASRAGQGAAPIAALREAPNHVCGNRHHRHHRPRGRRHLRLARA
jgi:hypothetical protein